jgi:hypothetical protein
MGGKVRQSISIGGGTKSLLCQGSDCKVSNSIGDNNEPVLPPIAAGRGLYHLENLKYAMQENATVILLCK